MCVCVARGSGFCLGLSAAVQGSSQAHMRVCTASGEVQRLTSKEGDRRIGLGSAALGLLTGDLLSSRIGTGDLSSGRGDDLRGDRLRPAGDRDRPFTSSMGTDLLRDLSISRRGESSGELIAVK